MSNGKKRRKEFNSIQFLGSKSHKVGKTVLSNVSQTRIEREGLTERAIILCKLNKSLLESSISAGIHRQKSLYILLNEPLYLTNQ